MTAMCQAQLPTLEKEAGVVLFPADGGVLGERHRRGAEKHDGASKGSGKATVLCWPAERPGSFSSLGSKKATWNLKCCFSSFIILLNNLQSLVLIIGFIDYLKNLYSGYYF